MTDESDELHLLLGGYVLGGLSDEDHRAFTAHLRTCTECQQELGQVSGLPRLLALADPASTDDAYAAGLAGDAGSPEPVAGSEGTGLADLLAVARRRRGRRRAWLAAVASAAAVAVFAMGSWFGPHPAGSAATGAASTPPPVRITATAPPGSAAEVALDLITRGWGTQLDLTCENMPAGQELVVYVMDGSGRASSAGTWRGTSSGYAKVTAATALRPDQIRAVEVRTAGGEVVASART